MKGTSGTDNQRFSFTFCGYIEQYKYDSYKTV